MIESHQICNPRDGRNPGYEFQLACCLLCDAGQIALQKDFSGDYTYKMKIVPLFSWNGCRNSRRERVTLSQRLEKINLCQSGASFRARHDVWNAHGLRKLGSFHPHGSPTMAAFLPAGKNISCGVDARKVG